ncbi:holin [Changchunvirus paulsarasin]|uniref:Holin n=2 Tax=Changchunvirus TaxID=2842593 RepID=A0AAE7VXC8_9CAUD|nr:holin [Escherichia phage vB_EcoS_W011D]QCW18500.1 holin [Escherichia phage vB_EcoS_W011D]QXV83689.1 holin [Escherichia phage PaulSarasin]
MKEFINAATMGTGGSSLTSAATGQITIAVASLVLMAAFGLWGAYLRWKDSKAFQEALDRGDIQEAIKIRGK